MVDQAIRVLYPIKGESEILRKLMGRALNSDFQGTGSDKAFQMK